MSVPKVAIVGLVVLVVVLGLPLGLPMSGGSPMCPDCDLGAWSAICVALLASVMLLVPRRATALLTDRARTPLLLPADALERPPRAS